MDDAMGAGGGITVERVAYRELLSNRSFRNLFLAGFTSSLGDWIGVLAILALTEAILGPTRAAAFALSGVMVARVLPTVVLGPVAGVFVDRWNRRRLLIWTDVIRGVIMALVAFAGDVWALFLATLAIEVLTTLFIPAKDAVVPNLVRRDQLVKANQLNLGAAYGTLPLGGALFALLVGTATTFLSGSSFLAERPMALPIWINAASFMVSALFIARIPYLADSEPRRAAQVDSPGAWVELKQGIAFIANQQLVRSLVVGVMAAAFAAGCVVAIGQLYARVLNAGSSGFGVMVAVVGSGLFVGLMATAPLSRHLDKVRLFAPGIGVAGVALALAASSPRLDLAMVPAAVMGFGAGIAFLSGYTLLQEHTTDAVRGRTFAAFNTGVRSALFLSLVAAPVLVGIVGPETSLADPDTGVVPFRLGGVRATLILAGMVALLGAVYTGRSIFRALSTTTDLSLGVVTSEREVAATGLFVAFEGGEGAGKSTQVRLLRAAIERAGHDAIVTREPGGTPLGEEVRDILLDPRNDLMADRAEALLYAAARAQHVEQVIRPALEKGQVILCDRYVDSSVVYQGVARGLGDNEIAELNRWATAELRPDLVIVLDVDPVLGLKRAGGSPDRLESAGITFHRQVNEAFRHRAAADPERYLLVDATQSAEVIHSRIRDVVLARLAAADESST